MLHHIVMNIKNNKFLKFILVGLVVLLIIIVSTFFYTKTWKENSNVTAPVVNSTFQPLYQNKEYGFQLTLNDSWKGYRIRQESLQNFAVSFVFEIPIESGWTSPFSIQVYPKASYKTPPGDPVGDYAPLDYKNDDTYLGENDHYFFQKSWWQDTPRELAGKYIHGDFKLETMFSLIK